MSDYERLAVIDRLEVGPPRVEPERITTPYTVVREGRRDTTELVYRYAEPVFSGEDDAPDLAAMVTAQVALNYATFCRELVFRGAFDKHDRRFVEKFAEHTSREIFVNKLLAPNPFLIGEAVGLAAEPRERYANATIVFESDRVEPGPRAPAPAAVDHDRHAVLSSGGKDSLLTYGILRELGREVHPIFVNESGRHWYTALNAHRFFESHDPRTARVWTNSDRVFAWMLRHLPFVRPDFAKVRSDGYPIRLWTVAVFGFGALPLLRARGIGRLLVGDEYDTTVRATYRGIPHYAGLYDQSRFFDDESTRYFRRKGWDVQQFSVLRPASELSIQKTLAERYPDLLAHQVSCHATHLEDGRARPCGRCEKCRRIVAMLSAFGRDATECGYDASAIPKTLAAFAEKGVHQEAACAEHVAHLLVERGALDAEGGATVRPRRHPEVVALRFDATRAPIDGVPVDLRAGVHRILLEHTEGAVVRTGGRWRPYDPLHAEDRARPYPFEVPRRAATPKSPTVLLGELTWPQAEARFREVDVALLPVGAIEQHGPHLPLDTDAFDAELLARRVAEACAPPRPIVLPLVAYGVSYHHDDFAGTLSISPDTQAQLVYEIGMAAARCGVRKLVIVNGHGGNGPALHLAAQRVNRDAHIFTCVDTGETSDADVDRIVSTPNDAHAGEIETSTSLAIRPELVDTARAVSEVPTFSSRYLEWSGVRSVGWYAYTKRISSSGVMGDPTLASAEKGRRIWDVMTSRLVELVEDLKHLSLDEIFDRRY